MRLIIVMLIFVFHVYAGSFSTSVIADTNNYLDKNIQKSIGSVDAHQKAFIQGTKQTLIDIGKDIRDHHFGDKPKNGRYLLRYKVNCPIKSTRIEFDGVENNMEMLDMFDDYKVSGWVDLYPGSYSVTCIGAGMGGDKVTIGNVYINMNNKNKFIYGSW